MPMSQILLKPSSPVALDPTTLASLTGQFDWTTGLRGVVSNIYPVADDETVDYWANELTDASEAADFTASLRGTDPAAQLTGPTDDRGLFFDGADSLSGPFATWASQNYWAPTVGFSIFMVCKPSTTATLQSLFSRWNTTAGKSVLRWFNSEIRLTLTDDPVTWDTLTYASVMPAEEHCHSIRHVSGEKLQKYQDGLLTDESSGALTSTVVGGTDSDSTMGSESVAQFLTGSIKALFVFDSPLTIAQHKAVDLWLRNKFI